MKSKIFTIMSLLAASAVCAYAGVYSDTVLSESSLVSYWRLGESSTTVPAVNSQGNTAINGTYQNSPIVGVGGALEPYDMNTAAAFNGLNTYVEVNDPGTGSVLDFGNGSGITLECWVKAGNNIEGNSPYVISKGRTTGGTDQNYGLQTLVTASGLKVKFLYRNSTDTGWNIWTSTDTFTSLEYHYLAVSYTFGTGSSFFAYVDGQTIAGTWTTGTGDDAPIQSNDDLWLGSSLSVSSSATFLGRIDEVAIYDAALSGTTIAQHYDAAFIPEPCTLALFAAGGIVMGLRKK